MRSLVVRVIFNITDAGHIRQTREMINTAVSRFKVLSHIITNQLLLELAANQQELSQDVKNLSTLVQQKQQQEEEEEEGEGEEEEEEEEEEFSHGPAPSQAFVGPNSALYHGFSISNGSGNMFNSNVGNIAYNNISNVGNNNSRNYYG